MPAAELGLGPCADLSTRPADAGVPPDLLPAAPSLRLLAGEFGGFGNADGDGARFYLPTGIATDGACNLYVADSKSHTIRKVVVATGAVTTRSEGSGAARGAVRLPAA